MNLTHWLIVMLCSFLVSSFSFALEDDSFSYSFKWGVKEYSIVERSGCRTIISIGEDSSRIDIMYGGACEAIEGNPEDVSNIASSINALIFKYDLVDEFKEKSKVSINISWLLSNWPLIDFINESSWWPQDFQNKVKDKYNKKEQVIAYRKMFEKAILDENVYGAILTVFDETGCTLTLSESFADPMNFERMSFSKDILIDLGVFSSLEAKKLVYPKIKGPVIFDLECIEENALQV